MLQSIRDRIQGWIAGVIIAIISVTFALWGVQNYIGSHGGNNRELVKLDHGKITVGQFNHFYRQVTHGRPQLASLTGPAKQMLKQQVLMQMVEKQSLLDELRQQGFSISKEQVRAIILQQPMFQENGYFSKKRFQQLLYANSVNEQQYIEQLQAQLMLAQLQTGLQQTAIVTPSELESSYALMNQTRNLGYFIVPAKLFVHQVKPSAQQMQAYYKKNQAQFMQPEQVSISYVLLSPKKIADSIAVSDKQIANFYQANRSHYRTPRKWMVADITEQSLTQGIGLPGTQPRLADVEKALKAGKSFSAYRSNKHWVSSTDRQQQAMVKALNAMKVGQVSDVIDVNGVGHILKLVAVQDPEQQPLSAVKAQVKQAIQTQQAQNIFSEQADKLANLSFTSPNSLEPAAKALGLKVQTTPLFGQDGGAGLLSNKAVLSTAFNPDTMTSGNNSAPINLDDGSMVVLRINKHVKAHAKPFAQVKDQIKQRVTTELALQRAMKLAEKLKKQLVAGQSATELAKQNKVIWYQKNKVLHTNTAVPQQVINAAFYTSYDAKDKAKNITMTSLRNNDVALVQLLGVQIPKTVTMKAADQQALATNMKSYAGQVELDLFSQTAVQDAKVKIHQDILASL